MKPGGRWDHICVECGEHENGSWPAPIQKRLAALNLCFSCDHWVSLLAIKDRPDVVRVKRVHYMVGPPTSDPSDYRGFGGRRFKIAFNDDGRAVETTNLWCQGAIPDRFQARLPDNAEFVE